MISRHVHCEASPTARIGRWSHPRAATIARRRARSASIRYYCGVALAKDAGNGRAGFSIANMKSANVVVDHADCITMVVHIAFHVLD